MLTIRMLEFLRCKLKKCFYQAFSLFGFRPVMSVHSTGPKLLGHLIALSPILMLYGFYVVVLLPLPPDGPGCRAPADPPEFMFASARYYLLKEPDFAHIAAV